MAAIPPRALCWCVGSMLLSAAGVRAATYPIHRFDSLQGVIVRDICQDDDGLIWVAADDGLWRWDGLRFHRHAPVIAGESPATTALAVDGFGRIWVGSCSGLKSVLTTSLEPGPAPAAVQDVRVFCLHLAGHRLYCGTNQGLFELTFGEGGETKRIRMMPGTKSHQILSVDAGADGTVWAGTHHALLRVQESGTKSLLESEIGQGRVNGVRVARDGAVWVGVRAPGGLYRLHGDSVQRFGAEAGLACDEVNALLETPQGDLWAATERGAFVWSGDAFERIGRDDGLTNEDLHALFLDRENQMWFGSYGGGPLRLTTTHMRHVGLDDGLEHTVVTGLTEVPGGGLLCSTLHAATRFDGRLTGGTTVGPRAYLNLVYYDRSGQGWCGGPGGWARLDETVLRTEPHDVQAFAEDAEGRLLIGANTGLFAREGDALMPIELPDEVGRNVCVLRQSQRGVLYVGTTHGLACRENGDWTLALTDQFVLSMHENDDGTLLAGTRDGLWWLRREESGSWEARQLVEHMRVRGVDRDSRGVIWGATERGVLRLEGTALNVLNHRDGLPSRDVRAILVDAQDVVYAGTTQGLGVVPAQRFLPSTAPPLVRVQQVVAGGTRLDPYAPSVALSYGRRDVLIEVRAVGWRTNERVPLQYRLAGESEWSAPTTQTFWHLPRLRPGVHVAEVRAIAADGEMSQVRRVRFEVARPGWLQPVFVCGVLAAAALAALIPVYYIRKRRSLQRQLRDREEQFRAVIDNTKAVLYIKDLAGRYIQINHRYEELFRITQERIYGRTDEELFPADVARAFRANDERVAQLNEAIEFEERVRHPDGAYHTYISLKFPLRDGSNRPFAVCGVSTDITERKRTEEALAERARLATLSAEVGVALTRGDDLDHSLQRCANAFVEHLNETAALIWVLKNEEGVLELRATAGLPETAGAASGRIVPGEGLIGTIAVDSRPRIIESAGHDPRLAELTGAHEGDWAHFAGYPLLLDARVMGVFAVLSRRELGRVTTDAMASIAHGMALAIERKRKELELRSARDELEQRVEERTARLEEAVEKLEQEAMIRRRAEESLQNSEARLRQIIDLVPHMIFAKDRSGRFLVVNRALADAFGMTVEEITGSFEKDINLNETELAHFREDDQRVMESGRPKFIPEETLHTPDGRVRILQTTKIPFTTSGTEEPAVLGVAVDITELKRIEELERAKQIAEDANRAKSEFLATMSHEVRTPLTVVLSCAELLSDAKLSAELRSECLETLVRNTRHLRDLLNDVLDISRIAAGKVQIEERPFRLGELLSELESIGRQRALEKELDFEVVVDRSVPAEMVTDPTRLRQILFNLLDNAFKFTSAGLVRLDVYTVTDERGGRLVFAVEDTGMGIPADRQEMIFESFTQVDSSIVRRFGGSGLGLAIARSIAQQLGGEIRVSSEPRRGSTFSLEIPLERAPSVRPAGARPAELPPPVADLSGRRVLLVDDSTDVLRVLEIVLRQVGARVTCASNGRSAVAHARSGEFDLVLLDLHMPEMDGVTAAGELRRFLPDAVYVALTADARTECAERCLAAGFSAVLTKPLRQAEILWALDGLVSGRTAGGGKMLAAARHSSASAVEDGPIRPNPLMEDPRLLAVAAEFAAGMDERLNQMDEALRRGEETVLRDLAHRLKGTGGIAGYAEVSRLAALLEHAIESGSTSQIAEQLSVLRETARRMQRGLCVDTAAPGESGAAPRAAASLRPGGVDLV